MKRARFLIIIVLALAGCGGMFEIPEFDLKPYTDEECFSFCEEVDRCELSGELPSCSDGCGVWEDEIQLEYSCYIACEDLYNPGCDAIDFCIYLCNIGKEGER